MSTAYLPENNNLQIYISLPVGAINVVLKYKMLQIAHVFRYIITKMY